MVCVPYGAHMYSVYASICAFTCKTGACVHALRGCILCLSGLFFSFSNIRTCLFILLILRTHSHKNRYVILFQSVAAWVEQLMIHWRATNKQMNTTRQVLQLRNWRESSNGNIVFVYIWILSIPMLLSAAIKMCSLFKLCTFICHVYRTEFEWLMLLNTCD